MIDNSNAFRMASDIALAIPQVGDALDNGPSQVSAKLLVAKVAATGQHATFRSDLESAAILAQQMHTRLFPDAKQGASEQHETDRRPEYNDLLTGIEVKLANHQSADRLSAP